MTTDMTTAKQVLAFLDQAMRKLPYDEARNLWDILTALRGPDNEDAGAKDATTCIIRGRALPECYRFASVNTKDSLESAQTREALAGLSEALGLIPNNNNPHFIVHAVSAFRALGLEWNKVNPPKKARKP